MRGAIMFNFSEDAVKNTNNLLILLKARLNSSGKTKSTDTLGNTIYIDCDIYNNDTLINFLILSLSEFNSVPIFTFFTFDDKKVIDTFADVLVEGATLYALSSKALLERGREFVIMDDGVAFQPSSVSELLNTQYSILLHHHLDKVKCIKQAIYTFDKN